MEKGKWMSGGSLWPCVILCHAAMAFLSLKPKATTWIAACLQQRAIFKVAGFCLQGPWCIVRTSLIDTWIVAAQHKNILLSGSDEGNCVMAPHACEGWHFRGDVWKIFPPVRTIVYFLCPIAHRKGTNILGNATWLFYLENEAFFFLLVQRKLKKYLLSYNLTM